MIGSLPHVLPAVLDPELRFRKYSNFLLALLARRQRATEVPSRPFELTLDLFTRCQLSCPYCSVGNHTIRRPPGTLSPELNKQVLRELGETTFIIWYFSTGEPLLNQRAGEIFRLAQQYEIFTVISTNLSLRLSDAQIDDLLRSGVGAICVSLDGASPETYARYRVGGDFELAVHNMARLIGRKRALGLSSPLVEWRFLVFRHNQVEVKRAKVMALELDVDLLEFFPGYAASDAPESGVQAVPPGTQIEAPSGPALRRAFKRKDALLHRKLGSTIDFGNAPASLCHQKCDWLYFGTAIFPGGSVGPCCVSNDEPDDFGRLYGPSSFSEIWNNPHYRRARRMFTGNPAPDLVCSRCPNPDAQDYQFRATLRALLRNAPNWVLLALSRAPDRFFWEVDEILSPEEVSLLQKLPRRLKPEPEDLRRLQKTSPSDDWSTRQIGFLKRLLAVS